MSVRAACLAFSISQTYYRHEAKINTENEVIIDWLVRLTTSRRNWAWAFATYTCAT